jgi:hypothetical protein
MRTTIVVSLASIAAVLLAGCVHPMTITAKQEGAEISVDGKPIGKSPATYQETTGAAGTIAILVKDGAREKRILVQKNQPAWEPVGAGAGGGVGGCLGLWVVGGCVSGIAAGVFPPCGLVWCPIAVVALASIPAGAGVGWYFFGNKGPDKVDVDLATGVVETTPPNLTTDTAAPPPPPPPALKGVRY